MITEKINEIYEKIDQTEFEPYLTVGLEPLRKLNWFNGGCLHAPAS
jgi:hypothetical protein